MLNKFAIVPEHFILATKEFKQQTHVLEPSDLEATAACIRSFEDERLAVKSDSSKGGDGTAREDGLFAFFNCGEHSGASQPHRHIQLLPVARMRDGLEGDDEWDVLASNLDEGKAPFSCFSERITLSMSGQELFDVYLGLYRQACRAVSSHAGTKATEDAPGEGETQISYNMAMTRDMLVVCPRLREGGDVKSADGEVVGTLGLNGTLLAGTALVKSQSEWDTLKEEPQKLLAVLRGIGIPPNDPDSGSGKL